MGKFNNDYYITLAGMLKDRFVHHVHWPVDRLAYNGLFIAKRLDTEYLNSHWGWGKRLSVTVDTYFVASEHYTLSSGRRTLAAALRTADRILERGYDEWHRSLKDLGVPRGG